MSTNIPLQFRIATPEDATRVANLVQTAFRAEDPRATWTGPDFELNRRFTMTPSEILSTINNPTAAFLMATTSDGTLVGAVATIKRSEDLARLAMLAVDPKLQSGGVGRRVLENAEEYAIKTWDVKKLGLDALHTRGLLIEWYERRGYVKTGEKTPFPIEAFKELELSEDLHFVEMEKEVGSEKTVGDA